MHKVEIIEKKLLLTNLLQISRERRVHERTMKLVEVIMQITHFLYIVFQPF
jgi:hypothetical protein